VGTRELLAAIARANGIAAEDVASAFFTSTADLRSAFPARAARDLGWTDVPLLVLKRYGGLASPL
jgi:chorismate mutase